MSDSELQSLSVKVNASSENSVVASTAVMSTAVITSAATGTAAAFSRRRNRGMSESCAATNSTSAAINVQAR